MRRRLIVVLLAALLPLSHATAMAGPDAIAQGPPEEWLSGTLPGAAGGVTLLAVTRPVATEGLVSRLAEHGCEVTSLSIASGGRLLVYVPGAPYFVNAAFPAQVEQSSVVLVRCASAPIEVVDMHLLHLVTPKHALSEGYVPDGLEALPERTVVPGTGTLQLTEEAAAALIAMLEAAAAEGHDIRARSAYRSHAEQAVTHRSLVAALGATEAERRSARPGHSEHQLGTTVDLSVASLGWSLDDRIASTPEGQWLARNAARFGFVESYPEGREAITGYIWEPWHLRYIGRQHASWLRLTGLTLTEYLEALHREIGALPIEAG